MALAWVSWTPDRTAFEVSTGANRFYEIYVTTRPELMQPSLAAQRDGGNWFSSRAGSGAPLPSTAGRALYTLPLELAQRFPPGGAYFMVKTFGDANGGAPARSPVMGGDPGAVVMTDVDPDGGKAMESTATDFEELAARFTATAAGAGAAPGRGNGSRSAGTNGHGRARNGRPANARPPGPARPVTAARSAGPARPVAEGRTPGAAWPATGYAGRRGRKAGAHPASLALAMVCHEMRAASHADPAVPGPSLNSVARVLSTALDLVPVSGPGATGPSAAAVCNGAITGRRPHGGREELARHIMRAAPVSRSRSMSEAYSHEQFLPALAALVPMLAQALPAILPMLLPLIQQVLGGLTARGKSLTAPAAGGADQAAAVQQLLAAVAAAGGSGAGAPAAAPAPAPAGAPVAPAAPEPPPSPDGGAPAAVAPVAPLAPDVGAAPAVSPDQAAALLGALQGAAGGGEGGGLGGMLAGPGGEMLKSIVDRLPIEKMFDGQAWIPKSNYDEWRSTMPWDAVLSLSEPTAVVGALFVPGRGALKPLPAVKLALVERTLTMMPGAGESWVFVSDRPARLRLEVAAGPDGLSRPFVDVRLSRDGTAAGGLWRSAFRLATLGPSERRVAAIEIPPDVLATVPAAGSPACVSIRVVQQSDDQYAATELRACFHVVAPATIVLDGRAAVAAAPELDGLAALERPIPPGALGPDVQLVDWDVRLSGRSEVSGLARYAPVGEREADGLRMLDGGVSFSPVGLMDLARRHAQNELGAEDAAALSAALDGGEALRRRLSIRLREEMPPALRGAGKAVGVRVEMGWLPARLVRFGGAGPDGNPSRRDVFPVELPVPRGMAPRSA